MYGAVVPHVSLTFLCRFRIGSPLIDGIFFVMRAVQFNARSACDGQCLHHIHDVNIDPSQADRALNWTARITKNIPSISGLAMVFAGILLNVFTNIRNTKCLFAYENSKKHD